jgi:hypothetical protein
MTYRDDLIAKLFAEARFYQDEANALKEDEQRRDNRHMGWREAQTITDLLNDAAKELKSAHG